MPRGQRRRSGAGTGNCPDPCALANRLGVWQLKWQLEDLAFRFQQPEQYQQIARLVAERRAERESFISGFIDKLTTALKDAGIAAVVKGRPKHIYSIWKKMQRKGVDFHELFDVRAVRILVDDLPSCYNALGLVHTLWQPIPGEFDDYITTPKGNYYQSLHTAVTDEEGRAVEIQIRTRSMHEHAELGVAAHWRYKEGGPHDPAFEKKIAVMRQLLEAGEEELDDESLLDSFRSATTEERVYVLTRAARWSISRRERRCWILPTRCIPRWATGAAVQRSTAVSCR